MNTETPYHEAIAAMRDQMMADTAPACDHWIGMEYDYCDERYSLVSSTSGSLDETFTFCPKCGEKLV